MPSSSSSEEDLSKFKEAADNALYNDSLFKEKQAHSTEKPTTAVPPSLRNVEEEDNSFRNEIHVTPEFRTHVAKHLSQLLDSQLDLNGTNELKYKKNGNDAENSEKNQARPILKPSRSKHETSTKSSAGGGVRLFGASAVFLSSMNIVPLPRCRGKRKHKLAALSSESSSDDSDSDDMEKLTAAAVSSDWVLSGAATKGWSCKNNKLEKCVMNKSGILVPVKDELSRGYESLNEIGYSNDKYKEALNRRSEDDLAYLKKNRNIMPCSESELAASCSSLVSVGSDSQADVSYKSKKKKRKKKHKRDQHLEDAIMSKNKRNLSSEDATTETTEVEDIVEERRKSKKVKKDRKKRAKYLRIEEKKVEEMQLMKECVPGLLGDEENEKEQKKREKKRRKHKLATAWNSKEFKKKSPKLSRVFKKESKKKMSKKVSRLSKDLANLMVASTEAT